MIPVQWVAGSVLRLPIHVTPKGSRNEILPFKPGDTEVRVKVSAPPEDGKANAAVVKLLSGILDVPKSSLAIVRGDTSRHKQVGITLPTEAERDALLSRLADALHASPEAAFETS